MNMHQDNPLFIGTRQWAEQIEESDRLREEEFDKRLLREMTAGELRMLIQKEIRAALYPKRTL
jgi:hypothetical protein